MTLIELRDFVRAKRQVSVHDISAAFHVEPGVIDGMMSIWVQKGQVRFHAAPVSSQCGSCCSCDKSLSQYYEWLETPSEIATR
ncbi:FeoC-like transcriptional regulator [Lonsdalea quercina]|uniref:FeoC-like transcriptional regulator n=1 Tax=Lonsdalea quercina TaxID=71657 RepID=UPI003975418F